MKKNSASYADIFAALGSQARLDIMRLLFAAYPEGMTVGNLNTQLKIPNSTLSHHLEKLRVEELVTVRRDRQFLWYTVNVEAVETLLTFLYNGCSMRYQTSLVKPVEQSLNRYSETTNSENTFNPAGFMFENFLGSIQGFFSRRPISELPEFQRFTPEAVESVVLAQQEALRLQHSYVGTEQMLVGLLVPETGIAAQMLRAAGVELNAVRQGIEGYIGLGRGTPNQNFFTPRMIAVVKIALKQAKQLNQTTISPEHLFLGLLIEGEGVGARVLRDLGFNCQTLERQVRDAIS